MKRKTVVILAITAVVLCLGVLCALFVWPGFLKEEDRLTGLQTVDGALYYYSEEGAQQYGWQTIDGHRYYFDPVTGAAVSGWFTDADGGVYYFGEDGWAVTGEVTIDGETYVFDDEGRLLMDQAADGYTWSTEDGKTTCIGPDGEKLTGLQDVNGSLYFFDPDGVMQTGWQIIGGHRYYFDETTGRAARGWYTDANGDQYYFGDDGWAVTGEVPIGGKAYKFDEEGRLITSPAAGSGKSGSKAASSTTPTAAPPANVPAPAPTYSWKEVNGNTYYMDDAGNYVTGLQNVGGVLYFFDANGVRQSGWQTIDGKQYRFDATTGVALYGWQENETTGKVYYMGSNGHAVNGVQQIGTARYYFDANGVRQNGLVEVSGRLYAFVGEGDAAIQGWYTPPSSGLRALRSSAGPTYYFGPEYYALTGVYELTRDDVKGWYGFSEGGELLHGWQTVGAYRYWFDDAIGKANTDMWATDTDGAVYLGANGAMLTGLQAIDGEVYCLAANGTKQTGWHLIDTKWYCFDGEGATALKNGWRDGSEDPNGPGGSCYLGKDGAALTGIVTLPHPVSDIDTLYYLGENGVRQSGLHTVGGNTYLFADDGAALYGWQTSDEATYYFGNDGVALTGVQPIGDKVYGFSSTGTLLRNWQTLNGKKYWFGGEGGAAVIGWHTEGSVNYCFDTDGAAITGVHPIGNDVYYFDAAGVRRGGWQTVGNSVYCFLGENDKALKGWFTDVSSSSIYYFGSDGAALTGPQTIGDKTYQFDAKGRMKPDAASGGSWVDNGGKHYYVNTDGTYVKGLAAIGGALYYFDDTGVRQTGWQTVAGKQYYFDAANSDAAKAGWFTDPQSNMVYYFGADGVAYTGIRTVENSLYSFDATTGARQTGVVNDSGYEYYFDPATGKAYHGWAPDIATAGAKFYGDAGYALTGLATMGGKTYYFNDAGVRQGGFVNVAGGIYLFDGENQSAVIGRHTDGAGNVYFFADDGTALTGFVRDDAGLRHFAGSGVQTFGWLERAGNKYYFGADGYALAGEKTLPDNNTYYFTADGWVLTGGPHQMNGRDYYFDNDGVLLSKNATTGFAWVEKDGRWYYINSAKEVLPGLQTVDGFRYCFADDGERLSGWMTIDGKRYLFGTDGKATLGWYTEGPDAYYFCDEGYALTGVVTLDTGEYEFDADGKLKNGTVPVYNKWTQDGDGNWYYYNSAGVLAKGLCTVDGEVYYFGEDGVRQSGAFTIDGGNYRFAADGKALRGWQQDAGVWYHFDEVTARQKLGWQDRYVAAENTTYNHYFNTDGSAALSWQTVNAVRRYFFPDGHMAIGWQTLDDGTYYFFPNGRVATGVEKIGDVYYSFDEDGRAVTGWNTDQSGNRYYFGEEGLYKGWHEIEDKWYVFDDETGVQKLSWQYRQDGNTTYTYYYDADGALPEGFTDISGVHRYFFEDGHMAIGWNEMEGGVYYFFPNNGAMATSATAIDGVRFDFAEDGSLATGWQTPLTGGRAYIAATGPLKGWQQVLDIWYYFDETSGLQQTGWQVRTAGGQQLKYYYNTDGNVPDGWATVDGIQRYFLPDGQMAVGFATIEDDLYYFDANGRMATGVRTIEGVRYSFGTDGKMALGWNTDEEGNRYYFTEEGALKGWQELEERWYHFDEETAVQQLGWQARTADGQTYQYYYYTDGTLPAAGWADDVDGASRYVLADGQMAKGWLTLDKEGRFCFDDKGAPYKGRQQVDGRWYYFDGTTGVQLTGWQEYTTTGGAIVKYYYYADGTLPAAGWATDIDSARRYVLADGQMASGWNTIATYRYYFNNDGTPLTGEQTILGTRYVFDAEGRLIEAPTFTTVSAPNDGAATKVLTLGGTASSLLSDKTILYSFDGGATWQTANTREYAAGTVIPVGTLRIKDSVGNVTQFNGLVTIAKAAASTMKGIDVSAHQGYINWASVKASGVDFAIIRSLCWNKATNSYGIDPYFDYNVRNAKANGLKIGTYLYSYAFSKAEMLQEINYFMNSTEVKNLMRDKIYFDMPVFIDYEDPLITTNTASLGIAARTDIVRYGMVLIEQMSKTLYGKLMLPGVYTYASFGKTVIDCKALQNEGYEFWLAHWDVSLATAQSYWPRTLPIWQYSNNGSVAGVGTRVDMNYCYKDYSSILGTTSSSTVAPVTSHNLTVTNQSGTVVTGNAASILAQIVMAEAGGFNNAEVYKAQAVAAQAWIFYQQGQGYPAPQVALQTPSAAVQAAVNEVVRQNLVYNGAQAFTPYYAYSNGTTNNGAYWGNTLPYLQSVNSPGDAAKGAITGQISQGDLRNRIEAVYGAGATNGYAQADWIKVTSTNAAGYVTGVSVCGHKPTVDYFYQVIVRYPTSGSSWAYPIKSPSFTIGYNGAGLWTFTSRGSGHGVGMSQYGAATMAAAGSNYKQILAHYYPGTTLVSL